MPIRLALLAVLAGAAVCPAQNTLSLSAEARDPGDPVSVSVSLDASTSTDLAGVQWTLRYSPLDFYSVKVSTGPAAAAAEKAVLCNSNPGSMTCMVVGLNANTTPSGVIATARFNIAWNAVNPASAIAVSDTLGATAVGTGISVGAETETVTVSVSGKPRLKAVVNAANYSPDQACSPGALAALFGTALTAGAPAQASSVPLPIELSGARLKANDTYLPLLYVSETQVNFQCPMEKAGERLKLAIVSGAETTNEFELTMLYSTPGLFSLDGSGTGQGAILLANTGMFAMSRSESIPSQPARPGDYVSIYAHGLGPTKVPVAAGEAAPLEPLATAEAPISVAIGGVSADVTFAGLVPGFVGLFQVNARVPDLAPLGQGVPVSLTVTAPNGDTQTSNTVTIAIEQPPG